MKLQCEPGFSMTDRGSSSVLSRDVGLGQPDFFGAGAMPGGWDEAAWTAQGLPTSGQLTLTLTITSVNGHPQV